MNTKRDDQPLRRYPIDSLDHGIYNSLIVGVVIAKQAMRQFAGPNGGSSDSTRAVWNFTIRDSVTDFMNATVWGSAGYVENLYKNFGFGDVVEVHKARIELRQAEDEGEQYRPTVTSPFRLTINENIGNVVAYAGPDMSRYAELTQYTTKPVVQTVSLADVQNNLNAWKGDHVDLLVVVQQLGAIRTINTKNNAEKMIREILVFDETHTNFLITLWDEDFISRSNKWIVKETILYMADVKVLYNDFRKTPTISLTGKSILMGNPFGIGPERLLHYAKSAVIEDSAILAGMGGSSIDLNSIKTVMNCHQIKEKINKILQSEAITTEEETFSVMAYGMVTQFDIDAHIAPTRSKCASCKSYIRHYTLKCDNWECIKNNSETETMFHIKMNIADHSGTLESCILAGRNAEQVLQRNVNDFIAMTSKDKADIKWCYLLNHCVFKLLIWCRSGQKPRISILACERAEINEMAERTPH